MHQGTLERQEDMTSYINTIRSKIGTDKFIHPAARIIIENSHKEVLIIERTDNGSIGIPAGALEEHETIAECIIREVAEETGLKIIELEVIGISSNPTTESVLYPNGDKIQYFTIEFYSNRWEGTLNIRDQTEVKRATFTNIEAIAQLPKNELSAFESLAYYREHHRVMLK
jgi:ADP-ribose pyrophosphatase YjhB (NUDIX family)